MNYANKEEISKLLFDLDISTPAISKETGINPVMLNRYKRREAKIDNMTLENAIKLQNYFNKLKEEVTMNGKLSREETFGRALGALDIISERHFGKNMPTVSIKYGQNFFHSPKKFYFLAHKNVMEYADKFGDIDLAILDRVTEYLGNMEIDDFTDTRLGDTYIFYISKERAEIERLIAKGELKRIFV